VELCLLNYSDVINSAQPWCQVAELAAMYEHRLQEGQKAIYHLEAFVARFMSEYKQWCIATFG
jgi:hypothetical protein